MSYKSIAIANKEGVLLTPKLQQLVYFVRGWYLALEEKSLVNKQRDLKAWPVIPSLYYEAKTYGNNGINKYAVELEMNKNFEIITTKPKIDRMVVFLLILQGFGNALSFTLSGGIVITLTAGATINILGIFMVVNYLFKNKVEK